MKKLSIVFVILYSSIAEIASAQYVTTIPTNAPNDRYLTEYFSVIRPGLSLNGYDNSESISRGLGLKQVLNSALSGDVYILSKLGIIFEFSKSSLYINPNNDQIEDNSEIIQSTAFEALASYVMEHNGIDTSLSRPLGLNIRTHADAMADLREKLIFISELNSSGGAHGIYQFSDKHLVSHNNGDYVKNVKSFQNIARAVDLNVAV